MDRAKRFHHALPVSSYYQCLACGEINYSPGWRSSPADTLTICCASPGKNKQAWPPAPVFKLLDLVPLKDLTFKDEVSYAVILLCAALDLLADAAISMLLKSRADANAIEELVPDLCVGEFSPIKLYNKVSRCSLDSLFHVHGLRPFLAAWESLLAIRNKIVRGHEYQFRAQDIENVTVVREQCLKAFAIVNHDVLLQVQKQVKRNAAAPSDTKTVLVVDDEELVCKHLGKFIERQGAKVYVSATGKEALDLYKAHRPGCVLLDVSLPDMDGFNVLEKIRQIDPDANVYFVTGLDGVAFSKEAKRLGARGHFTKPVDLDKILGVLQKPKTDTSGLS